MTYTRCVTIMEACTEVTTQVCGLINHLGLNQYILYTVNCLAHLLESVFVEKCGFVVIELECVSRQRCMHESILLVISVFLLFQHTAGIQWMASGMVTMIAA